MNINRMAELLEPAAVQYVEISDTQEHLCLMSCAISLKRIADRLCSDENLKELVNTLSQTPVNHYGEGLSEAIQNSIERGLRGINTHDR